MTNTKKKKKSHYTAEEGLKKVRRGEFAFFLDTATAYKIIKVCRLFLYVMNIIVTDYNIIVTVIPLGKIFRRTNM